MTISLSEIIGAVRLEDGALIFAVPEEWSIGRTTFGGLQAAMAIRAMRTLLPEETPLRSLQTTFIAPVPAGRVEVRARLLRSGKNTTHIEARLVGGAETLAIMVGVFGAGFQSNVSRSPDRPIPPGAEGVPFRYAPGVTPNCVQHFEARWLRGRPPTSGDQEPNPFVELAMKDPAPASEYHLPAIADFMPPIPFSMAPTPVIGASMTWMLEILSDNFTGMPLEGWHLDAQLLAARDGFISQAVTVWGPEGAAIALSHQCMLVFA
jgi:hypothetical protein